MMAETTVAPVPQCDARSEGLSHCFHSLSNPISDGMSVSFPGGCCFCGPAWINFNLYLPWNVPNDMLVTIEMKHGPRVVVNRAPKPGPQLAIAGGNAPSPRNIH